MTKVCPICETPDAIPLVSFPKLPVFCNVNYDTVEEARAAQRADFSVSACRRCGHIFNPDFDASGVGYTQSYENSLHFSPRFVAFASDLVDTLTARYGLRGGRVIDIGCGKGDFLRLFHERSGVTGYGFDRSLEEESAEPWLTLCADWFGPAHAGMRPDLVTFRHVLEHIEKPLDFLRNIAGHPDMSREVVVYAEVPNALYQVTELAIWDFLYEHVQYFTPQSLRLAFETAGYEVIALEPSFGGQYLSLEARLAPSRVDPDIDGGAVTGLLAQAAAFSERCAERISYWNAEMAAAEPGRVVVWGAGTKGVTFVNVVSEAARAGRLADVSPRKRGRYVTGLELPICGPADLVSDPPDKVVVMNPMYREEIAATLAELGLKPDIALG